MIFLPENPVLQKKGRERKPPSVSSDKKA